MIINIISIAVIIFAVICYYSSVRSKNELLVMQAKYIEALKKDIESLKSRAETAELLYKSALTLNASYRRQEKHPWSSRGNVF